jgi:hypothetical protein
MLLILSWTGHISRLEENEISRRVLEYKVEDRKRVRRPRFGRGLCTGRHSKKLGMESGVGHMAKDVEKSRCSTRSVALLMICKL